MFTHFCPSTRISHQPAARQFSRDYANPRGVGGCPTCFIGVVTLAAERDLLLRVRVNYANGVAFGWSVSHQPVMCLAQGRNDCSRMLSLAITREKHLLGELPLRALNTRITRPRYYKHEHRSINLETLISAWSSKPNWRS